ncbi:Tubulin polyglutamylase TTLL7 [Lamellibrachia satsuma]|nr:Tubulin polyglutamylase TTLL7 [Lamellibrachia satsuma]
MLQVVDIVRSNVRAVIQKAWKCTDVDTLHLYRVFSRVFNRLLWSHGQGLWNCFQASGNSWETIFNKSSDHITPFEMACCRRIVQLCRDCLLIVYQFAAEAKNTQHSITRDTAGGPGSYHSHKVPTSDSSSAWSPPGQLMSQRMSRLYHNRSQSISSLSGPS